jgi:beta-lactamase superfamily II metal-dependent hydrolase
VKNAAESLHACVLKVGHHGSRYSSTAQFLSAVGPELAVVSVGRNSFGHPDKSTLSRLVAATGSSQGVMRTDEDGAMTIVTDGRRMKVIAVRRKQGSGKE